MILDKIDKKILLIILTHRNGKPVSVPSIDRILLDFDENFILDGLLSRKLIELENKNLIHSPTEQIGYSLTEQGLDLFKDLIDV